MAAMREFIVLTGVVVLLVLTLNLYFLFNLDYQKTLNEKEIALSRCDVDRTQFEADIAAMKKQITALEDAKSRQAHQIASTRLQ